MSTEDQSANGAAATPGGDEEVEGAVLLQVIETLRPLSDRGRLRTVDAALRFLGTIWAHDDAVPGTRAKASGAAGRSFEPVATDLTELPRRVQIWLSQNQLSPEALAEVFHRTASGVELIVTQVPGPSNKDRTINCYLLCGIRALLGSGEPQFDDDEAREICRDLGCFNSPNHATYVKAIGNLMGGSKASGYELTQPGLRSAAELLRTMTTGNDR